jgi:2-hydroxycyclohexanecarboxyl-CoA dehydrogenase
MIHFEDRVAIVTGAGGGIGKAIAATLCRQGAKVVLTDVNEEAVLKAANELRDLGETIGLRMDVTSAAEIQGMVETALSRYGKIDVLVNNAGWDKVEPFLDSTEETWEKIIAINFKGPVRCCKAVLPSMISKKYGRIVNISSDAARVGSFGEAVYSGAKGGLISFTKTLAREMARHNICVNCICPGPTETALFHEVASYNPKMIESLIRAIPLQRIGQPQDIANAVVFLASDSAAYITGQVLSVSGGMTMV